MMVTTECVVGTLTHQLGCCIREDRIKLLREVQQFVQEQLVKEYASGQHYLALSVEAEKFLDRIDKAAL